MTKYFLKLPQQFNLAEWLRGNLSRLDNQLSVGQTASLAESELGFHITHTNIRRVRASAGIDWKTPRDKAEHKQREPKVTVAQIDVLQQGLNATATKVSHLREAVDHWHREVAGMREQMNALQNSLVASGFIIRPKSSGEVKHQ